MKKNDGEFAFLESAGSGCTHFKFDKLLNISLDKKIKNIKILNYVNIKQLNKW